MFKTYFAGIFNTKKSTSGDTVFPTKNKTLKTSNIDDHKIKLSALNVVFKWLI